MLKRIAITKAGKRTIQIPVALVLTKWDCMEKVSSNYEEERSRAIRYIEKNEWLLQLYEKLLNLCTHVEVFPIYCFIGDKPSRDNIRPFHITTPLLWAVDQSEAAMLEQAKAMAASQEYSYPEKLDYYWRLLNIEKIRDRKICQELQSGMEELSQKYLASVKASAAQDPGEWQWIMGLYRQLLRNKAIQPQDRETAQRELRYVERRWHGQSRRFLIKLALWVLLVSYALCEICGYYLLENFFLDFEQGKSRPQELIAGIYRYRRYCPVGNLIAHDRLKARAGQMFQARLAEENRLLDRDSQELEKRLSTSEINQSEAEKLLATCRGHSYALELLVTQSQNHLDNFAPSWFRDEASPILARAQQLLGKLESQVILYNTRRKLEQFAREGKIKELTPQKDDPLVLVREKQEGLTTRREQCRQIEAALVAQKITASQVAACETLYRKCLALVEEQEKRCRYFLLQDELNKIKQRPWEVAFDKDTPGTLAMKLEQLNEQLEQLRQWPQPELLPDHYRDLCKQRDAVRLGFANSKNQIANKMSELKKLEDQCKNWGPQWQQEFQNRQSYRICRLELDTLSKDIKKWDYLEKEYSGSLEKTAQELKKMRAEDHNAFREIQTLVAQNRFIQAKKQEKTYSGSSSSLRIMKEKLQKYFDKFSAGMEVELKVDAGNVKDPGWGGDPDMQLTLSGAYSNKYYHKNSKSWSEMLTITMKLGPVYQLDIKVLEIDSVANDDYGGFSLDLQKLLDNELLKHAHKCGGHGNLSVTLTPTTITPGEIFPSFEEE